MTIMKGICILWLVIFVFTISSCIDQTEELQGEKVPIWNVTDIKLMQLGKDSSTYAYNVEVNERPPFYKGNIPLSYVVVYPPWGIREYPLAHDFKDFKNYFVYSGSILVGARTYNEDGSIVLAEMRLNYSITNDGKQRIIAEEFHYRDGKLIFKSKSEIDAYEGIKTKEIEKIGNKIRDYYFILPIGRLH